MPVALIVDIVGSRELADRVSAQKSVNAAFGAVPLASFRQPLWPTVGDEFQAVFTTPDEALHATTLVRLALPSEVDCRFGLGEGEVRVVDDSARPIQDGSAWWNAREAIQEAHRREDRSNPWLRSWFRSDNGAQDALVNSYLLIRDEAITGMTGRERRLTVGALTGASQSELATREGISQSAVSQSLRRSGGAALIAAAKMLEGTGS